jgi:hypothetical protein
MTWVRVDDSAFEHPKLLQVGARAAWLWLCCLSYANRQKRHDGLIPKAKIGALYPGLGPREARDLVRANLLREEENNYRIHDYHEYQPSSELSSKRSAAGKQGGTKSGEARRSKTEANGEATREANTQATAEANHEAKNEAPIPARSRPDPRSESKAPSSIRSDRSDARESVGTTPREKSREREAEQTECPADLLERAEVIAMIGQIAGQRGVARISLEAESREFLHYWRSGEGKGEQKAYWIGALRTRLERQCEENRLKPPGLVEHEQRNGRDMSLLLPPDRVLRPETLRILGIQTGNP